MLSYCSSEKKIGKTVKNCSSKTQFGQKLGQHGPRSRWSPIFFLEITKRDHKLSRTFNSIKISYVLTELWMIFWLAWYFAAKTSQFRAEATNNKDAEQNRQFPFGIFLHKISPDLLKLRTKAEKSDIQFLQHT